MAQGASGPSQFYVYRSEERTATPTAAYIENDGNARGVRLFINTTDADATPSVVFKIQIKDAKNAVYHDILSSAAVTATGAVLMEVYPTYLAAANVRAGQHIGRGFRVVATHADSDAITYSVVGEWLP
jgi:aspartyl aminopeptidase